MSSISFHGARPVTTKLVLPLTLSALELTLDNATPAQTAHGLGVSGTDPLNTVAPPAHHSSPWHEIRLGLICALLLLIAATVAAIPSSEGEERREPSEG